MDSLNDARVAAVVTTTTALLGLHVAAATVTIPTLARSTSRAFTRRDAFIDMNHRDLGSGA